VAGELGIPVRAHRTTLDRLGDALRDVETFEIADGETLDLDGTVLESLHTPGHAAGHLAFRVAGRDVLIAGDLVSGLSTILIDPDEGDMGAYLDSLARVDRLGCRTLLPAHGAPLTGSRVGKLIEHRTMRAARILEALNGGDLPLASIAEQAYAEAPGLPAALTETQARSHLLHLERAGRVRRVDDDGSSWSRVPVPS
jgi:glyoxylase-like metal-dependent hydrolase (beta-lactamase superfamily II)